MSWTSADFRSYPARCMALHRQAATSLDPVHVGVWASHSSARAEATLLRQFRYLVRSNPGIDFSADRLFSSHSFRTRIDFNDYGDAVLLLFSKPNISALVHLNPDLADILQP